MSARARPCAGACLGLGEQGEEKSPKLVEVLRPFKVMLSVPEVSPLPLSAGLLGGPGVHQILTARL